MNDERTKTEAELMRSVRWAHRTLSDKSLVLDNRQFLIIYDAYKNAVIKLSQLEHMRVLERLVPGATAVYEDSYKLGFSPGYSEQDIPTYLKLFEVYIKAIPKVWRVRRLRETKELSDKLPGEI